MPHFSNAVADALRFCQTVGRQIQTRQVHRLWVVGPWRLLWLAGLAAMLAIAQPALSRTHSFQQQRQATKPNSLVAPAGPLVPNAPTIAPAPSASAGMTVADMDQAVSFYERGLSFEKISDVEVYGRDYEHLLGLFGLRMRGVQMRLGNEVIPAGFGVEFLDYLSPSSGRPYPSDSQTHDLWHWDITVVVDDAGAMGDRLQSARVPFISSGVVALSEPTLGFSQGFLVRDPDGHAVGIIEP